MLRDRDSFVRTMVQAYAVLIERSRVLAVAQSLRLQEPLSNAHSMYIRRGPTERKRGRSGDGDIGSRELAIS
jgi:hypothetical protein